MPQSGGLWLAAGWTAATPYLPSVWDGKANGPRRVTKNSTTRKGGGVFAVGDSKDQKPQSGGLIGKLRAVVDAYKGVEPDSTEGRMVADIQDMIGTLEALYMDALVDASENFDGGVQKITTEDSGGVNGPDILLERV